MRFPRCHAELTYRALRNGLNAPASVMTGEQPSPQLDLTSSTAGRLGARALLLFHPSSRRQIYRKRPQPMPTLVMLSGDGSQTGIAMCRCDFADQRSARIGLWQA